MSTINYSKIKDIIDEYDAVLIGAGAGLSTSAGMTYSGERFHKYFSDFEKKYGIKDMYSGGFYPFENEEELWAFFARSAIANRYNEEALKCYKDLLELVKNKDYFIITTNVDHQFQKAGFNKSRLYYMQGDYDLIQCSTPCHQKTYESEELFKEMVEKTVDCKIPKELVPHCPKCGEPMMMNLRIDDRFVQDKGWYKAQAKYMEFISKHKNDKILYLELGVGFNTPGIIKYPFWRMTYQNPNAFFMSINPEIGNVPSEIEDRAMAVKGDIANVLEEINNITKE